MKEFNSLDPGPLECQNCKEIELRLDAIVRDPKDNHPLFGEYVCVECGHYQTMDCLAGSGCVTQGVVLQTRPSNPHSGPALLEDVEQ